MRKRNDRKGTGGKLWPAIIMLALVCPGCRERRNPPQLPQLVKTARVERYEGNASVSYPGRVKAAENVKLAFRVPGPIARVHVEEGQRVKKGQLLAELDARDYRLQYEATRAEYRQVTGEADRIIELFRRGTVPVNEYDKAIAAKKRISVLYRQQLDALNDTKLRAPFDGYIRHRYFNAPEIVAGGTPVLSMLGDSHLEVSADIPATDFIRREEFAGFHATADILPGRKLPLELLDIARGANFNQLFNMRFRLQGDEAEQLAAGMSVTVTIAFKPAGEDLNLLPVSALFQKNGDFYVWLYDGKNQVIHRKKVEVEQVNKDGSVLVKSAFDPGQTVISAGVDGLEEGQRVKPLPPVPASNVGGLLLLRPFARFLYGRIGLS